MFFRRRTSRKKKVVSILPPPDRNTAIDKKTVSEKPNTPAETHATPKHTGDAATALVNEENSGYDPRNQEAETKKSVLKKTTRASGLKGFKSTSIRISEVASGKAKPDASLSENTEESTTDGPMTPFTEQALHEHWENFAQQVKAREKESLYSTLLANKPIIKDKANQASNESNESKEETHKPYQLQIRLSNKVQAMEVEEIKMDLLTYLREALNNYGIRLTIVIAQQEKTNMLYTDTEKINAMIKKNPVLRELIEKFDLDVRF